MWVISFGTVLRVEEREASPDGWEVVERPSPWHGLMISDAEDLLEEPGGDLWITTLAGLVHLPAAVRRSSPPIPAVELVEAQVDGQAIAVDAPIVLSHRRNRIELRFSALSFRDPGLLRYEARLRPAPPGRRRPAHRRSISSTCGRGLPPRCDSLDGCAGPPAREPVVPGAAAVLADSRFRSRRRRGDLRAVPLPGGAVLRLERSARASRPTCTTIGTLAHRAAERLLRRAAVALGRRRSPARRDRGVGACARRLMSDIVTSAAMISRASARVRD
jgi:hypothetical protein